jgi:hypothetical protein
VILFLRRGWISQDTNCSIPVSYTRNLMTETERIIDRVAARAPGAIVIDPKRVMCDAQECPTYLGNIALYKDSNHLNAKAATVVARLYIEKLGNPFGHDGKTGNSERNAAGALREVGALR